MKNLLLLSSLALISASCSSGEPSGELPSDILFEFKEIYVYYNDWTDTELVLHIETEMIFPYLGTPILFDQIWENGTLTIHFHGVQEDLDGIRLPATGPAVASIPIEEPLHEIVMVNGALEDRYEIIMDKERIQVDKSGSSKFSQPTDAIFHLYPENSFACICGTKQDDESFCDDFRTSLPNEVEGITEFQFGEGHIPYPDSSAGFWINTPTTFYTYDSEKDFIEASRFMQSYSEERIGNQSGISIYFINWKGEYHRTWD